MPCNLHLRRPVPVRLARVVVIVVLLAAASACRGSSPSGSDPGNAAAPNDPAVGGGATGGTRVDGDTLPVGPDGETGATVLGRNLKKGPDLFIATTTTGPVPVTFPPPLTGCSTPAEMPPLAADTTAAIDAALANVKNAGTEVGVSVSTDTNGEVVSDQADVLMRPASNQKLLVAFAALDLLPGSATLDTNVVVTGPTVDRAVQGDLVLVGAGDPSITSIGPHSLAALASQVAATGISRVEGRLLVDDSRYDNARTPNGWPDSLSQANVGSLSAMVVDRNRSQADRQVATDPAVVAARTFRTELGKVGVTVAGTVEHGSVAVGHAVARLSSPKIDELVRQMLSNSDNLIAELLVKEIGLRRTGSGTTADGLATINTLLGGYCGIGGGKSEDGSGLSALDRQHPSTLRRILVAAQGRPWFPTFQGGLPVSGKSGTLALRLTDPAVLGKVRAKTGSTAGAQALSGYLLTSRGTQVTFSILVGTPSADAEAAIDQFVGVLATSL